MKISQLSLSILAVSVIASSFAVPFVTHADTTCNPVVISSDANTTVGGNSAVVVSPISPYWTASIPNATWIWTNDTTQNSEGDVSATFSRTVTLSTIPASATLSVSADDIYTAYINGTEVGSTDESYPFMSVQNYDIGNLLTAGTNTITITVTNLSFNNSFTPAQNPGGLLYSFSAQPACEASSISSGGFSSGAGVSGSSVSSGYSGQTVNSTFTTGSISPSNTTVLSPTISTTRSSQVGISGSSVNTISTTTATSTQSTVATTSLPVARSTSKGTPTNTLAAAAFLATNVPYYGWIALFLIIFALLVVAREYYARSKFVA